MKLAVHNYSVHSLSFMKKKRKNNFESVGFVSQLSISLPKKRDVYEPPDSLLLSGKSFGRNRTTLVSLNESRSSSAKIKIHQGRTKQNKRPEREREKVLVECWRHKGLIIIFGFHFSQNKETRHTTVELQRGRK